MDGELRERLQQILGDAYVVERELGGGGMSRVFLAEERALGRRVVVKVLAPELAEGMSAERFAREVRVAARLQHPNIVPVLATGERDGLAYYTMPYVEGESLRARLSRERRLGVDAVVSVLRDVARALEHAHTRSVVHRDIKPDNILLAGNAATVADFGIAKALHAARTTQAAERPDEPSAPPIAAPETLTHVGMSLGTPQYMSPEQAAGDPDVDARADIYAWGVVGYELLAGAPPFAGASAARTVAAQIGQTPTPLLERAPDVPPVLAALVMRCLEKDPTHRPQTAGELVTALEFEAGSVSRSGAVRTLRGRRRQLATGLAAALLLTAGVSTAAYRARHVESPDGPTLVVVLPFENLGAVGDAYFADGLTEEVRARLSSVTRLRVIGGTSARLYKGTRKSTREIGRELGATHALTATVRWERTADGGGRVRVNTELVRASDQERVWSETYEEAIADVFRVQSDVAERVARALDVALLPSERRIVAARSTRNIAAYDAYLRGLAASTQDQISTGEGMWPAIREFERAVALDPSFGIAHARLAQAYSFQSATASAKDSSLAVRARRSAARAWEFDSTGVESLMARGTAFMAEGKSDDAERVLRSASDLEPGNAEVFELLAIVQQQRGHHERAIASARQAVSLNPRSSRAVGRLAELYDRTFQYELAIRTREKEIALTPSNPLAYAAQAYSYLLWRGDTAAARHMLERGGPKLESHWLVWFPSLQDMSPTLSEAILPRSSLSARDTVTLAGFLGTEHILTADVYHLMKMRHFALTGRRDLARVHADSLVILLAPALRTPGDEWPLFRSQRAALAEAYVFVGRRADATREVTRVVEDAERAPNAPNLPAALASAAYIDVLVGRYPSAVERLAAALRLPAGMTISRGVLRAEPSWAPLRGRPDFERLLAER